MPEEVRTLALNHFSLDEPVKLLVQCGFFIRLEDFWKACGTEAKKAAKDGRDAADAAPCLERLLRLYNAGAKTPIEMISPKVGDRYDSGVCELLSGGDGPIRKVLLPGFRVPSRMVVKAIVTV